MSIEQKIVFALAGIAAAVYVYRVFFSKPTAPKADSSSGGGSGTGRKTK